jgi:hypothetical protein
MNIKVLTVSALSLASCALMGCVSYPAASGERIDLATLGPVDEEQVSHHGMIMLGAGDALGEALHDRLTAAKTADSAVPSNRTAEFGLSNGAILNDSYIEFVSVNEETLHMAAPHHNVGGSRFAVVE